MENIQKNQTKRLHLKSIITSGYNKACNGYIPIQALLLSETEAYTCHGIKSLNGVTSLGYVILIQ